MGILLHQCRQSYRRLRRRNAPTQYVQGPRVRMHFNNIELYSGTLHELQPSPDRLSAPNCGSSEMRALLSSPKKLPVH
ncbi:unnamed protein product [Gongylonema pulchrum]|uniref:Uncharacterized protein n=1 Tax=Gongylonema pulchrum TaxID=637853 RepID=A0A183DN47_9BILA|nr:unnamed protein product [Gongylonema pulchrum]